MKFKWFFNTKRLGTFKNTSNKYQVVFLLMRNGWENESSFAVSVKWCHSSAANLKRLNVFYHNFVTKMDALIFDSQRQTNEMWAVFFHITYYFSNKWNIAQKAPLNIFHRNMWKASMFMAESQTRKHTRPFVYFSLHSAGVCVHSPNYDFFLLYHHHLQRR